MSVRYVVVDGSNLATEGRSLPSLQQLDEAVRAYMVEDPAADIVVVVDASFEHRVEESERTRFKEAEAAGELVTPPAGAIGRGDAFILKIAERANAVVLSNDSFQEFHGEHPWLFDEGRLIGGKPVRGVGWIFTPRLPVRGVKSQRATKAAKKAVGGVRAAKAVVTLPAGVTPSIGDTISLAPKKAPAKRVAKKVAAEPVAENDAAPVKKAPAKRVAKKVAAEPVAENDAAPVKKAPVKRVAKKVAAEPVAENDAAPVKKAPVKRVAKKVVVEPLPDEVASVPRAPRAARSPDTPTTSPRTTPVNGEEEFKSFARYHRPGSSVSATVHSFTSHGALVHVTMRSGAIIECYAPKSALASPPPARARDVLRRGEQHSFTVVSLDLARRTVEVSLI